MEVLKYIAVVFAIIIIGNVLFIGRNKFYKSFKDDKSNKAIYTEIIVIATLVWLGIIFTLWINSNKLAPNNLGDFLAGTFAPVLFVWVVFGILLQKKEFSNAVDEYKKSVKFLKKQSINADIQHQNTWFDRNAEMLEKYIDALIKENGPLEELNTKIIGQNIYTFRNIVSNIMNIVELDNYINSSLKNVKNNEEDFNKAIDNLNKEYNIIFGKNINSSKKIALKIYLHTYRTLSNIQDDPEKKNDEEYKVFIDLKYLITDYKLNAIREFRKEKGIEIDSSFVDIMSEKIGNDLKKLIICGEETNEKTI